jgi:hypothetical protein
MKLNCSDWLFADLLPTGRRSMMLTPLQAAYDILYDEEGTHSFS